MKYYTEALDIQPRCVDAYIAMGAAYVLSLNYSSVIARQVCSPGKSTKGSPVFSKSPVHRSNWWKCTKVSVRSESKGEFQSLRVSHLSRMHQATGKRTGPRWKAFVFSERAHTHTSARTVDAPRKRWLEPADKQWRRRVQPINRLHAIQETQAGNSET